ncbi:MAG TPA: acyl-ACP desaturase [Acidimicrobiales bacterium]|nr:acyl-ACP desaturase [Acidimicrobiales bacterium]
MTGAAVVPKATFSPSEHVVSTAERLLERHLQRAKEWFPHELVPWSEGRDFERDSPAGSSEEPDIPLPAGVKSALFVNLLTEDNLPHYFHVIAQALGDDSALGEWTRRWTAEEQRHSIVLRDWITVTRQLDLVALERARMRQVTGGFRVGKRFHNVHDGFVYLTLQELATRIAHHNTGQLLADRAGGAIMTRVATDENLHFLFYRDLVSAALEEDPSGVVLAIDRQVAGFEMPGAEIEDFSRHAAAIASARIYDFQVHFEQILVPVVLRRWKLESLEGLTPEAEAARDSALHLIGRVERVARRLDSQRAKVDA